MATDLFSTPRSKFFTCLVLSLIGLGAGTLIWMSSHQTLDGLAIYDGKIGDMKITKTKDIMQKGSTPVFIFTVTGIEGILGIQDNFGDFDMLTNHLKDGDVVRIYYDDKNDETTDEGYRCIVSQLEKDNVALLDINKTNQSNATAGYVVFGLALLGLIYSFWFGINNLRRSNA